VGKRKKRCCAIRWGTYGDLLYALPVLEILKKKYGYLHLETTTRGMELFRWNPTFDRISAIDIGQWKASEWETISKLRWTLLQQEVEWDRTVNFWRCLEYACIPEEHQIEWHWEREKRRQMFAEKNFYDEHFKRADIPVPPPDQFDCGTMYFQEDTAEWARYFKHKYRDRFIVAMPLAGSTGQKVPQVLYRLAQMIHAEIPEVLFVLLGGHEEVQFQFSLGKGNVAHACGEYKYDQSAIVTKFADYVVGPETSLLVMAGLFGTPKSMLCTSSGYTQTTAYQKNDFSTNSTAPCSPCYRAIYDQRICPLEKGDWGEMQVCNFHFDLNRVMEGVRFAYEVRQLRRSIDSLAGTKFGSLPDLRPLFDHGLSATIDIQRYVSQRVHPKGEDPSGETHQQGTVVPCSEVYFHKSGQDS